MYFIIFVWLPCFLRAGQSTSNTASYPSYSLSRYDDFSFGRQIECEIESIMTGSSPVPSSCDCVQPSSSAHCHYSAPSQPTLPAQNCHFGHCNSSLQPAEYYSSAFTLALLQQNFERSTIPILHLTSDFSFLRSFVFF